MTKTKQLEIKTTKIDWLLLIQLALDKKDWGKSYTIHKYKDVNIKCIIQSINFEKNVATFKITCEFNNSYYNINWYNTSTIDFYLNNFKVSDFERLIKCNISRLVESLVNKVAKDEAESLYLDIKHTSYDVKDEEIEVTDYKDDYFKAQNISYDFSETIIDEIKDKICYEKNREFRKKVREYVESFKMTNSELQNFYNIIKIKENNND